MMDVPRHGWYERQAEAGKKQLREMPSWLIEGGQSDKLIPQLEAENQRLRTALEQVEWEPDTGTQRSYCPWCGRRKEDGHDPSCDRQLALHGPSREGV